MRHDDRAVLEGRIAFAAAAIALAGGLVVLLDRIGLPANGARWIALAIAAGAMALIGVLLRAARISSFYAASRAIPASYSGLAAAAAISGALLVLLPPLPAGLSLASLALGGALGAAGLALVTAPLLRGSGAFSLADLISARFPAPPLRLATVALAGLVGLLTALAGLEAASRLLVAHLGVGHAGALALCVGVLLLAVTPGGLSSLVWSAAAAGGALLAALAVPALLLAGQDGAMPLPFIGDAEAFAHAADRIASFGRLESGEVWLAAPIALGLMGFAPLALVFVGARNRAGATHGLGAGAIWLALILAAGVACMAFGAIGLDVGVAGQRPDRLADALYQASADGWLTICGQSASGPGQARAACSALPGFPGALRASDVSTSPAFLLFGLGRIEGGGGATDAFILAGAVAVSLALAGFGLQCAAAALGHDLWYKIRERAVITSRRLATTRLMLLLATVGASLFLAATRLDPRLALGGALTLSACGLTPLLVLSLWPRAGSLDAGVGLICGLAMAGFCLHVAGEAAITAPEMGVAAAAGAAAGLIGGVLASLRPGGRREPGAGFRHEVLRPGGELTPDRGA